MSDIARLDPEASLAPRNLGCGMTPTAGTLYAVVMRQPALTGCRDAAGVRSTGQTGGNMLAASRV
jgi:hypothetical protein